MPRDLADRVVEAVRRLELRLRADPVRGRRAVQRDVELPQRAVRRVRDEAAGCGRWGGVNRGGRPTEGKRTHRPFLANARPLRLPAPTMRCRATSYNIDTYQLANE